MIFALAGATIFASNVFSDWQGERTITSLKTISKPVNELDFPSVTICKDGQNMQAVRERLDHEKKNWVVKRKKDGQNMQAVRKAFEKSKDELAGIIRKKRSGQDDCQLLFHRDCEQVVNSHVWFPKSLHS